VDSSDMSILAQGFAADIQDMVHVGDPRWITLYPSLDGALLEFTADGTSGATNLAVIGKRKYLR
jgi:hypothetical protein